MSEVKKTAAAKGAKVPQDHKAKANKLTTGKFRISPEYEYREVEGWEAEIEGVELFIPKEGIEDARVQEHMAKIRFGDTGDQLRGPLVLELIYGTEQWAALKAAAMDPTTGRPDNEKFSTFVEKTFAAVNPN